MQRSAVARPLLMVGLGSALLYASYLVWVSFGYLNMASDAVSWALVLMSFFIFLRASRPAPDTGQDSVLRYSTVIAPASVAFTVFLVTLPSAYSGTYAVTAVSVAASAAVIAAWTAKKQQAGFASLMALVVLFSWLHLSQTGQFQTDEIFLDYYASHLALRGIDPYTANIAQSLVVQHVPLADLTPLLSGGFFSGMDYPALSFLVMLPFDIVHADAGVVPLTFFLVSLVLVYMVAWKREGAWAGALAVAMILMDFGLVSLASNGDMDTVWVFFLLLSEILMARSTLASGVSYGLSVAAKQIPLLVAPFMLVYLVRQRGWRSAAIFALSSVLSFMAIDLPYIAASPASFLSEVARPETGALIWIGQGPSLISFTGIYLLSKGYFTMLMAVLEALLAILYAVDFRRLALSFPVFPILVMFFNYRLLFNYLAFWPMLLVPVIFLWERPGGASKGTRQRVLRVARYAAVAVAVAAVCTFPAFHVHDSGARIVSVELLHGPGGNVSEMVVTVEGPGSQGLHFRSFGPGFISYPNGILWRDAYERNTTSGSVYVLEPWPGQGGIAASSVRVVNGYSTSESIFARVGN